MRPLLLAPLLVCLGAGFGCGGDDAPDPRVQCETFREALCARHSDCMRPTERARALEDCLFAIKIDLDCDGMGQVSGAYDECLAAISNAQCGAAGGISLPTSCRGIFVAKGGL